MAVRHSHLHIRPAAELQRRVLELRPVDRHRDVIVPDDPHAALVRASGHVHVAHAHRQRAAAGARLQRDVTAQAQSRHVEEAEVGKRGAAAQQDEGTRAGGRTAEAEVPSATEVDGKLDGEVGRVQEDRRRRPVRPA